MNNTLRQAFRAQSSACADLGSPFMGQLCRLLADRLEICSPLTERLFAWQGDLTPAGESVPLRLCGALHALHLHGADLLKAVYPPTHATDDVLWQAIDQTLHDHADFIDTFIDNPPQTNEVRRASALIAAAQVIAHHFSTPIRLSELGASAGLNLNWDHFALNANGTLFGPPDPVLTLTPHWSGPLPPNSAAPRVVERRGVDLNPIDPARDRLRLLSYLWPDQPHRLGMTDTAMSLPSAPVDQGDAIDWLAHRLPHISGQTHMIYTTIAWQYFPESGQIKGRDIIESAGRTATNDSPLAFVQMENDGGEKGAALTLRLWPGDLHVPLARIDFHGRWIDWTG